MSKLCLTGLIISLICVTSVYADTRLSTSYLLSKQSSSYTVRIFLKEGLLAIQNERGITSGFYDSDRDVMVVIDHPNKSYYEINHAFVAQIVQKNVQVNIAMTMLNQQMENAMAEMDEAQKQKLEEILPDAMKLKPVTETASLTIIKIGKTNDVAGIKCEMANIQKTDKITNKLCIASSQAVGVSEKEMQSLIKLGKLAGLFTHLTDVQKFQINIDSISASLEQLQSIPLTMEANNGTSGHVTEIGHDSINNSIFTVPEGFQKKELMDLMKDLGQQ